MARLMIPGGPFVELGAQPCVVGRLQNCGLTLDEAQSSRKHFQVVPRGPRYAVEDLGSRNGMLLNGEKVQETALLYHGDEMQVGDTIVRYESAAGPLMAGVIVGGCTVGESRGRSSYGALYAATQGTLERPVILELADPDLGADQGFQTFYEQRARLGGSFDNPKIRAVFDVKRADGFLLTIFERLTPTTLSDELGRRAFDRGEVLGILEGTARVLGAVHKQGKVHGTFSPDCLRRDDQGQLKLCDLGNEPRLRAHRRDAVNLVPYASPEEARGHPPQAASDVYSLGVLGYRMLAGSLPYQGRLRQVLTDHGASASVEIPEGLPPALRDLLGDMLSKVPTERPSADEVAERVAGVRAGGGGKVARGKSQRGNKTSGRKKRGASGRLAGGSARGRRPTSSAEHPRAARPSSSSSHPRAPSDSAPQRRPLAHRSSGGLTAVDLDTPGVTFLRLVLLASGYVLIAVAASSLTRMLLRAMGV